VTTPHDRPRRRAPATEEHRARVLEEITAAVDDGRLDVVEGGRRLSTAYRAATAGGLAALVADLHEEPDEPPTPDAPRQPDRAQYVWATALIVLCAVAAAVLLVLVLRGPSPPVLP